MESILAQMGAFGTIGSHPDEVRGGGGGAQET
jgi:hypothetical protein